MCEDSEAEFADGRGRRPIELGEEPCFFKERAREFRGGETLVREGSHLIDCYTTDHVFAGFCILQIGQIGQFDVFGYIADGSAYCLRNLAQHRLILQ